MYIIHYTSLNIIIMYDFTRYNLSNWSQHHDSWFISSLFYPAAANSEYDSTSRTITFIPEDANLPHCVDIAVFPDNVVESSEVFSLSISSTDQAVQITQPNTSAVVIADLPPGMEQKLCIYNSLLLRQLEPSLRHCTCYGALDFLRIGCAINLEAK